MWGDIVIAFLLAFITAFVVTPYTMRLAKKVGAIDIPDKRKVHSKPIPRLGGIAIIVGFLISVIYLLIIFSVEKTIILEYETIVKLIGFIIGILILAIVCFVDDAKGIPALVKLAAQILAALVVISCGIRIDSVALPFLPDNVYLDNILTYAITLIWIIGVTNAINLIDGLDGLSSGISLIASVSLLIIFSLNGMEDMLPIVLITALAGAIVGFLPFNFNPAKTFVGDTGSNFLGFSLAVISIMGVAKTYTAIVVVAPIIILGLPIFDTLFAIVRRIIKGKSLKAVFSPDKGHLHHRLMARGYTQKQSVLILYGLSATLGFFAIILLDSGIWKALSFALIVAAIVSIGYKDLFKKDKNEEETEQVSANNTTDIDENIGVDVMKTLEQQDNKEE